jgi:hypothetical protein
MSFVHTPYSFDVWEMYIFLHESVYRLRDMYSAQFAHRHTQQEVGEMRQMEAQMNVEPHTSDWRFLPVETDITPEVGVRQTETRLRWVWSNDFRVHPIRDHANSGRGLASHQLADYYQSGQQQ